MAKKENKKLVERIHRRYKLMLEADQDMRREAMDDMKFINVPGEQWDLNMKKERGDRPCYEFNKLRITAKRIINDMRLSRPAGKVRAVEDGDSETAEIYEGLIRNIANTSDFESVVDYEAEYQVSGGMGAWRIVTQYSTDTAFEQDIAIEAIPNPFTLFADPAAKDQLKKDAEDWILTERISKSAYENRWPNREIVEFEATEFDDEHEWQDEETVRIAEYWYKEPVTKELWQLADGKVIEADSEAAKAIPKEQIKNTRQVKTNKIMMCIASGDAILEGPVEWAGSKFPFVIAYGEFIIIDGKRYWFGIGRFGKDAQRSYNVSRTAISETIAMAPQAKFWATPDQAKGNTEKWAEAHQKNFPYLIYNPDPKSPGPPIRMGGADVPVALINESQISSEDIKAVTGIFSPDVGAGDQASSGVQERERRAQGAIATFNYQDNMNKAIRYTWELLVDLIPKVLDTERQLRVLGSDDTEEYVRINTFAPDEYGNPVKINDLSQGRFDVTITTGPSYSTQRQEASEIYMNMANVNPAIFQVAGDLMFKSLDLPYSDDIAERLKILLPPEIQQMISEETPIPPEVQAIMEQAQQAMMIVQEQAQMIQQAAMQTEQEKAEVDKGKAEIETLIAELKTEEAQLEAKIAKEIAKITVKEAQVSTREAQQNMTEQAIAMQGDQRQQLLNELQASMSAIHQVANEFMQQASDKMEELRQIQQRKERKPARIEAIRQNGKLVAVPIYED